MQPLQRITYWKAPYFVKNWMASLNARKLDRQRYGPEYEQIRLEIAQHDKWSTKEFLDYQQQELRRLIRHAASDVPYYRKVFSEAGICPESITGPEDLQQLPILEKKTVRSDPKGLVDETLNKDRLMIGHTSGTTGTPLDLYRNVWLYSKAAAYFEERCHAVLDVHRRCNPSVSIGGHIVTEPKRTKPPFWVYNRRWKQLYMSSYHLSPKYLGYYVDKLREFKADYIEGYPSSVYAIAQYIVHKDLEPVPFKACFTTAEVLFDYQRNAIKKAFGCRTCNQYGCAEMAVFAAECTLGSMHLSPEIGIVEVVDDNDKLVGLGQTGQLICTSLINDIQLFIRYRIGDIGSLSRESCPCGSPLPVLKTIQGREGNVLISRDGSQVGEAALSLLFYDVKHVLETQFIQDEYDRIRVRLVPAEGYRDADGEKVVANLEQRLRQVEIHLEVVDKIERTAAGKLQVVVSKLLDV